MPGGSISVFLADDSVIVREGVRAILALEPDIEVVGVAYDYDQLVAQAGSLAPQVLVTDIRMPPTFQREGIDAAKELRKRHPGSGVVVLSQYDDPEYAVGAPVAPGDRRPRGAGRDLEPPAARRSGRQGPPRRRPHR
jgi:DNA-binding NarL/FixJ family response regulator